MTIKPQYLNDPKKNARVGSLLSQIRSSVSCVFQLGVKKETCRFNFLFLKFQSVNDVFFSHLPGNTANRFPESLPQEWRHVYARIISFKKLSQSKNMPTVMKSLCEHKFAFQIARCQTCSFLAPQYYYSFTTDAAKVEFGTRSIFVYLMDSKSYDKLQDKEHQDQIAQVKQIIDNSLRGLSGVETNPESTEGSRS